MVRKSLTLVLLMFILILAALIRFRGLNVQSLWLDEIGTYIRSSSKSLPLLIQKNVRPDVHPPAYFVFMHFWIATIGSSEIQLRLPSAIAGVIAIGFVFLLGKRIYSVTEGLIAAALTAVLWFPVYYSQEARMYSFLLLFTTMSSYSLAGVVLSYQRSEDPPWTSFLGYGLTASLASYLHYFGIYHTVLQAFVAFVLLHSNRYAVRRMVVLYVLLAVGYLPWLPYLLEDLRSHRIIEWVSRPGIRTFHVLGQYFFTRNDNLIVLCAALYAALFTSHIIRRRNPDPFWKRDVLLLLFFTLPIVLIIILSLLWSAVLIPRSFIILVPAAYLLLARAIVRLPIPQKMIPVLSCLLVSIFLADLIVRQDYYRRPAKTQLREAVSYVLSQDRDYPDSRIIGYAANTAVFEYYLERLGSLKHVDFLVRGIEKSPDTLKKYLDSNKTNFVWLIVAHMKPKEDSLALLESRMNLVKNRSFVGTSVWLFQKKTTEP